MYILSMASAYIELLLEKCYMRMGLIFKEGVGFLSQANQVLNTLNNLYRFYFQR